MDCRSDARWRPPGVWRVLLGVARVVTAVVCRLRVTGDVPEGLRQGPMVVAANHVGVFDPIVVAVACRSRGFYPRFMAAGGLFRTPGVGWFMRACGMIRVDRRSPTVSGTIDVVVEALARGSVVVAYPEGRIGLDPGVWPERGKTGVARVALATDVPVVPLSQWGAHEVMTWAGAWMMMMRLARAVVIRPVVRVHIGPPVDLSDITPQTPAAAKKATDRIMSAITQGLIPLRAQEPRLPAYVDPTRPVTIERRFSVPGR